MLTLKADIRDTQIEPAAIRKAGSIPAVFYGRKEASTPISISEIDFLKVWKEAGESTVVTLKTPDGEKDSLIHDVAIDPVSGKPQHADFYVFEAGKKLEVEIPLEFVGVSPAVTDLGANLVKVMYEVRIEAVPKDLPHKIEVDISTLTKFDDHILAKDLSLPTGVELITDPEEVVAIAAAPREEKEEESAPMDLSSIEVEKKGKEETSEDVASSEEANNQESKDTK